jgi:hypothetical protein
MGLTQAAGENDATYFERFNEARRARAAQRESAA